MAPASSASSTRSRSANEVSTTTCTGVALLGDPPRRLDAVHARHRQVHQHDVRPLFQAQRHRRLAVAGRAHHLQPGIRGEQLHEAVSDDRVVVHDHHPDHVGAPPVRRWCRSPGCELTRSSAPADGTGRAASTGRSVPRPAVGQSAPRRTRARRRSRAASPCRWLSTRRRRARRRHAQPCFATPPGRCETPAARPRSAATARSATSMSRRFRDAVRVAARSGRAAASPWSRSAGG